MREADIYPDPLLELLHKFHKVELGIPKTMKSLKASGCSKKLIRKMEKHYENVYTLRDKLFKRIEEM